MNKPAGIARVNLRPHLRLVADAGRRVAPEDLTDDRRVGTEKARPVDAASHVPRGFGAIALDKPTELRRQSGAAGPGGQSHLRPLFAFRDQQKLKGVTHEPN